MRGLEDHFDRRVRRVSLVEQLEEFDELTTAMAIPVTRA